MGVAMVAFMMDRDSGLPEDRACNTWHFGYTAATLTATVAANMANRIQQFYMNQTGGTPASISRMLSSELSGTGEVNVYDLADPQPRQPKHSEPLSVNFQPGPDALPGELAVCLSYKALALSGDNQARRRGRIFLGPLAYTVLAAGTNATVKEAVRDRIKVAASALLAQNNADQEWVVYSRVDGAGRAVIGGWIDNAFDTQRRRGSAATTRTLWP